MPVKPAAEPIETATPVHDPAATGWIDGLIVVGVLVLAGLLGSAVVRNSDIWLHLAAGRNIETSDSSGWYNASWLFDLGLYHVFSTWGGTGVALLRAAIVVLLAVALMAVRSPGSGLALPASFAALALVAANARLIFVQPALVSYLFLAVLVCILHWRPRAAWAKPLAVGVLCAAWANLDGWFILGPAVIAVWLIGSLLQPRGAADGPGAVAVILFAALAGCLINPVHVRAFALPDDLVAGTFVTAVQAERMFDEYLTGVFGPNYPGRVGVAPAYALYGLFGLGIASFALNVPVKPWRRLALFAGLAGLAVWRSRQAPFFAVGAAPLIMLNFQEWLARQDLGRAGRLFSLALRGLGAVAVVVLCLAAWPGWLGRSPFHPYRAYRVNPTVETDPSTDGLARQVGAWYASGRLTDADQPFSPSVNLNHYLAWHAPQARAAVDVRWGRWRTTIADWVAARRKLEAPDADWPAARRWLDDYFRRNGLTYLADHDPDAERAAGVAMRLWVEPTHFPWWGFVGRATAFGWAGAHPELRIDLKKRAFEPAVATLPAPPVNLPVVTPWDLYQFGPPPRPVERDDAATLVAFIESLDVLGAWQVRVALTAGVVGSSAPGPLGAARLPVALPTGLLAGVRTQPSDDRVAAGTLALRSARATLAQAPADGRAALDVAKTTGRFLSIPPLEELQFVTALTQAQTRLESSAWPDLDPVRDGFDIADNLARFLLARRYLDLGVAQAREALRLMPATRAGRAPPEQIERERTERQDQLEQMQQQLKTIRDRYELEAEGKPIAVRFALAVARGLPNEALNEVQRVLGSADRDDLAELNFAAVLDLMLRVGRAEDARAILLSPTYNPVTVLPPEVQPVFRQLHMRAAAATGDFGRARDELQRLIADARTGRQRSTGTAALVLAGLAVGADRTVVGLFNAAAAPLSLGQVQQPTLAAALEFELHAWQGLLALQEGNTVEARAGFDAARRSVPARARIQYQEIVEIYQRLLASASP